jgi:Glycosyltransferase sugar-binding region containing DXD motif
MISSELGPVADNQLCAVQGVWVGPKLSLLEQLSIRSFLHHGHPYHLYVYDDVRGVPDGVVLFDANTILPQDATFHNQSNVVSNRLVSFSDLFRYKLLLDNGGTYVDLDLVCLRPIDLQEPVFVGSEDVSAGWPWSHSKIKVNNNVMRFPRVHPFIKTLFEEANTFNRQAIRHAEIGPDLVEKILRDDELLRAQVLVCPEYYFNPVGCHNLGQLVKPVKNPDEFLDARSYTLHLYSSVWRHHMHFRRIGGFRPRTWMSPLFDCDRVYATNTVYGMLQKKYGIV